MLRIRFHGRGGQGMKTASRIVGTAGFLQGYVAQDSPVYGAERRGAPMIAFTRLSNQPIHERGLIWSPNLIVIADETLIPDPLVRPLLGLRSNGIALVNSTSPSDELRHHYGAPYDIVSSDFTGLALEYAGSTSALSVAIGVAAANIAGLRKDLVDEAVHLELTALGLEPAQIQKNRMLASVSFDSVTPKIDATAAVESGSNVPAVRLVTPTYEGGWVGTASVAASANTPLRKTGDWRVTRPVIDLSRCTRCWICFVSCPDGAISLRADDTPLIDYTICKGCMLCMEECPIDAVSSQREAEAG
jgi:pyruvate ferredoxin oxidoreductase gamma subunit